MKKFFTLFLTLMTSVMLWAFKSGDLYYNITSNVAPYTVEVTSGNTKYSGDITIPSSVTYNGITYAVTSIGERAFERCFSLTSVTIPNSVKSIADGAFWSCSSLTSVTIPNSVTSIGSGAFYYCSSLTSVTIPNSVTSIGDHAFDGCSSLTSVTIPNSVTSIGNSAFKSTGIFNDNSNWENGVLYISNCLVTAKESLSGAYTIKNGTRIIADYAFYNCSSLTSVTIPNSVTSIGESAFMSCSSLTSVSIPNSVTSIGDQTFLGCSSLTSVTIPNSVTSIGSGAFSRCSSLTSVTIPNSVTSIGIEAFYSCSSLTSVTIPNSVTSIGSSAFYITGIFNDNSNWENGVLYISNCLVAAKESLSGAYTIKNGTRILADYAFSSCSSLTSVTIPNSVTSIGDRAFSSCSSLTSVTIPNSVTSIGSSFYNCTSLTSVTIPNSVTSIGGYAFLNCTSLTSVTIPNSVTSIGNYAFYSCSSLTSVTIPNSVTSIGSRAFYNCSSLNTIYVGATNPPALMNSTFAGTPSPLCYIPCGTKAAYEASDWAQYVSEFVEDCDNGSYSRNVRIGYNTICLPHGSSNFTGATFYEIAHILKNKKKIFFDEVKTLEAGKPYIFYPHSNEVTVYYDNTTSAVPLSHNGLHGTFDGITAASNFLKGKFLVVGDRMVLCGDGCSLAANRAYIELDEISDKDHPAIPGIKRVSMDYSEENATTALDNITDESIVAPMQEGVYDILGRKVDAPTVSGFYIINGKKVFVAL